MFICEVCGLQYNSKSGYNKHMRTKHVQHEKSIYPCNNCDSLFYNKKLLISHLKNEMQLTQIYKQVCSFENCNKIFKTFKMYSNHLETIHEVNIVHNKLNFNTIEEFNEWKSGIEEKEGCQYVKRTSQKHSRDKGYIYFFCHRSFDSRTTNNGIKSSKSGGSVKTGHVCPSNIVVHKESSKVSVDYCSTHLWHEMTPVSNPLVIDRGLMNITNNTDDYNSQIKNKIEMILGMCNRTNLNDEDQDNVLKHCDKILDIFAKNKDLSFKKTQTNLKRKIEPQVRFMKKKKNWKQLLCPLLKN